MSPYSSRRIAWAALVFFLGVAALVSWSLRPASGAGIRGASAGEGSGALLEAISRRPSLGFGFRNALADLVWLQAIQVAAPFKMTDSDLGRLAKLLNVVIRFDPRHKIPYVFGGILLGDSQTYAGEALRLLELGHRQFPDEWQMLAYAGYTRYFTLGDPLGGGEAFRDAARIPGSPPFLPFLASRMLTVGRDPNTALEFLLAMLPEEKDPANRARIERRIGEVVVERDLQLLEKGIAEYRASTGRVPGSLRDLLAGRFIDRIPEEPFGGRYQLSPDGKVSSSTIKTRMRVFRK
jgi:hypothetical protein